MTKALSQPDGSSARDALSALVKKLGVQPSSEITEDASVTFSGPTAANTAVRLVNALRKERIIEGEEVGARINAMPLMMPGMRHKIGSNVVLQRQVDGAFKLSITASTDNLTPKLEQAIANVRTISPSK